MARVHGLDEMKPWNHLAAMPPLGDAESKIYPFDEAIEVIKTAFAEVNPEMADSTFQALNAQANVRRHTVVALLK